MTERLLQGRTAVVTGAASGIGFAIAEQMAAAGAAVVLSDLRVQAAQEAAAGLRIKGLEVREYAADASREQDIRGLISFAERTFGTVDIVVNNAGMQHVAIIEEFPVDKFQQMLQLMVTGPFMTMKYAFPIMKNSGHGRVVNVASINGLVGFAGKAAYNSAKHGLIGLTKVAALEVAAQGITVNALCPGYVDTPLVRNQLQDLARQRNVPYERVLEEVIFPLVPQARLIDPLEIADYAVFLASDKARGVTGQAVVMDGGYLAQ